MRKTAVWAHRGASGWDTQYGPENTMIAFEKAVAFGADGIETDIQMTKDGEIVICHDERIDRTSDGTGWIREYTLQELSQYCFCGAHPAYGDARIPTLAQLLELLRPTDLFLNIELKTGMIWYEGLEEKALRLVKDMGMAERVIWSSFNHYSLEKLHALDPAAEIGLLCEADFIDLPDYADRLHAAAIHPPLEISTDAYVEKCHAAGKKIHVWTVDVKTEMKRLCDAGADAIITDCPDHARRIADGDTSVIPGFSGM